MHSSTFGLSCNEEECLLALHAPPLPFVYAYICVDKSIILFLAGLEECNTCVNSADSQKYKTFGRCVHLGQR